MKIALILICHLCFLHQNASAQFAGGFFSQKKTARSRALEQIALYNASAILLTKGYNVITRGLEETADHKAGDLKTNTRYFRSLGLTPATIRSMPRLTAIFIYAATTQTILSALRTQTGGLPGRTSDHLATIDRMTRAVTLNQQVARAIINSNGVQMSDDERIARINKCWTVAAGQLSEVRSLYTAIGDYNKAKERRQTDIRVIRRLHGLP